ncbi:MAG: glycosyltransferase family 1 protein, partial [Gammaproteobacteria bacterium]|nr:glycosyltransferase family 1 protein [Gammaproteobacteria bacterium]
PGVGQRFGEAGKLRMQNEFSIDTMADDYLALYETVLNG